MEKGLLLGAVGRGGEDAIFTLPAEPTRLPDADRKVFLANVKKALDAQWRTPEPLSAGEAQALAEARATMATAFLRAAEEHAATLAQLDGLEGETASAGRTAATLKKTKLELDARAAFGSATSTWEEREAQATGVQAANEKLRLAGELALRWITEGPEDPSTPTRGTLAGTQGAGGYPSGAGGSALQDAVGLASRDMYVRDASGGFRARGVSGGLEGGMMGKAEEMLFAHQEKREKREMTEGLQGAFSPGKLALASAIEKGLKAGASKEGSMDLASVIGTYVESKAAERLARARADEAAKKRPAGEVMMEILLDPEGERDGGLFFEEALERVYGDKKALLEDLKAISLSKNEANFRLGVEKMINLMKRRVEQIEELDTKEAHARCSAMRREMTGLLEEWHRMEKMILKATEAGMTPQKAFDAATGTRRAQLRKGESKGEGFLNTQTLDFMGELMDAGRKKPRLEQQGGQHWAGGSGLPALPPPPRGFQSLPPPPPDKGAKHAPTGTKVREGIRIKAQTEGWLGINAEGEITAAPGACWKCAQPGHESRECADPRFRGR